MSDDKTVQTTYEEATRCPKCKQPGQVVQKIPRSDVGPGVTQHVTVCRTETCSWFETPWFVQVNADGSVPPDQTEQHKADARKAKLMMPVASDAQMEAVRDQYRGLGTHGNEEWPNPHGR